MPEDVKYLGEVTPDFFNQPDTRPARDPNKVYSTVRPPEPPTLQDLARYVVQPQIQTSLISDAAEVAATKSDEEFSRDFRTSPKYDLLNKNKLGEYIIPDSMLTPDASNARHKVMGDTTREERMSEQAYDYKGNPSQTPVQSTSFLSELGRGVRRGKEELIANAVRGGAMLRELFGDQQGAEDWYRSADISSQNARELYPDTRDQGVANYIAGTIGEQVPNLGVSLISGGLGALKYGKLGSLLGTGSSAALQETTGTIGEIKQRTDYAPGGLLEATTAGLVNGAIETLALGPVLNKLGLGNKDVTEKLLKDTGFVNLLKESVLQAGREGATEAVQELTSMTAAYIADPKSELFSPEFYKELIPRMEEAALAGATVGGVLGGGAQLVSNFGTDTGPADSQPVRNDGLQDWNPQPITPEEVAKLPTIDQAEPVQDGNSAITRPDTTPAPAVPGQTPAEPTRPVMPMEKPVPATSGLAEMEQRANEAIKQQSNKQVVDNTGVNQFRDATNMVQSNNITPIEDIIPVPGDGNTAVNAVEEPADQIPTQETITGAGITEPMESLKQIALALNPNSEVTIETAARSLADDVDQMVQSGQLSADQRDQYITDKLTEAGLQGVDPATVDAAGKNYIAGEKAVISLAAGADPTTAVHEAVESQIKSYFGNSDIEASPEFKTFQKSVKDLGLAVYDNNKKALEWFSDFLTDYVFASQKMRKDLGDETVDPVWQAVQDWNAKTKGRGKLAKLFSQMREWFRDTISRARNLRKALYGTKNNVDVTFADDVLKGKKVTGKLELQVVTEKPAKLSGKPDGGQVYDYNKIKSLIPADTNSGAAVTYLETGEAIVVLPKTKQAFSFTNEAKMDSFIRQVIKDGGEFVQNPSYQLRKNLKPGTEKTDNLPVTQDKEAARNNISSENTAKAGTGELDKLRIIARKYDNANDFRKAFTGNGRILGESEQYEIDRIGRLKMLSDDVDAEFHMPLNNFLKQYPHEVKTTNGLKDIKPNQKTIKIYRSATGGITPGDWVGLDKDYAEYHSRSDSHKIVSMEVPLSDLKWAGTSAEEWFYAPDSVIEQFKDFDPISFYEQSFNSSAGTGPGDVSYQLRSRPEAYARELAALSGVKAEKLPKIPAKTVVTGKLEGGFLVGESIKLTDKNRNSLIRQTEREIKKNRQYQEFLDQFRNAIPDMPQGLIQISKHDAGEYRQAVPAGYRKYFIYKENRNDKFAIPWDTVLQRWHESDASISADMPVDDFMRLFTHYRQMLTASDKSIVDLVAYDAAKYEPEIGLLLERRKLLLDGKNKAEVNTGLMEYGKSRGMSDTDVRGAFSGKGDLLVHSAKDKPMVRQLMRQLTDTQNKLLKERYGKAVKKPTVKQVINEQIKPTQEKTVTPAEALRYAMKHEATGSNEGWKAGQLEIKSTQKEAQAFIQNNLPLSERGRLLSALKNATSPKKLEAVVQAVNKVHANYDRREARKEFLKVKSGLDLKHMRPEYKIKAEQILADITEKSMADKVRNRLVNLIKAAEEDGAIIDPALVQIAKDRLADAGKTELKKMEAQAIRDLTNALKYINHMNKLKNELIFGKRSVELQAVADLVVDNLSKQKPLKSDGIKDPKRSRFAELAIEGHIKPDLYSYMIDNGVSRGPFHGIMYEQIKAGERKYLQIQHDGEDALRTAIDKAGLKWGSSDLVRYSLTAAGKKVKLIPTVLGGKSVKLSRAERIDLLANILDPDTANEIKRGGVKLARLRGGNRIRMTWEDIEAFKKSITSEEMALAEGMRAFLNGQLKNDINNTWVDLAGLPKATRENYWPRQRATEESQKDTGEALRKFGHATLEGQGIFKEREGSKDPVLIRDAFEVYYQHLKQTGAVIGMAVPVRNARVILAHPDVHKALINTYGKQSIEYWNEHIDSSTMLGEPAKGTLYKVIAQFQNQFAPAVLGLNPSPTLKQFVGLVTATIETGDSLYVDGLAVAKYAEMKRIKADMDKYSPELRQRYRLDGIHLMSPYFGDGKTMLGRRSRQEIVMKPMEYTDRMVVSAIWRNTERRLKKLHPDWNKDQLGEATARRTEKIVNRTQNVTSPVDLSGIGRASRNNPLAKLGTMFMSQANNITNLYYRSYYDYAKNGDGKKFLNSQYKLALGIVASVAIGMALSELYAAGRKDREPVTAGKVAERLLYEFLGNFFGGKEIASLARKSIDAANGKPTFFSNTDNAVESFTNEIGDIFTSTIRAIKEIDEVYQAGPNKGEAKTPKELKKAAFSLAQVMAIAFGIPTKPIQIVEQIDKTIDQNTTKKPVKRRTY